MKNRYNKFITILVTLLIVILLTGCQENKGGSKAGGAQRSEKKIEIEKKAKELKKDEKKIEQKAQTENEQSVDERWKDVLINYLDNQCEQGMNQGYDLIYLNDDDIPELVEYGLCEATGSRIITVSGDSANVNQLRRIEYKYIERGNLLDNHEGVMGYYYDMIYEIRDGKLQLILDGEFHDHNGVPTQDENLNFIYDYFIEGEQVSKEEYQSKIESIFPASKVAQNPEWNQYYSFEEIKDKIKAE